METRWNLNAGAKRMLGIAVLLWFVFAPGAQAQNAPTLGIRFPLYVVDNFGKIVKVDSSGNQTIFASGGILGSPVALAFDRRGNLFVASPSLFNDTIVKVDEAGTQSVFASGGNFAFVAALAFDVRGDLYVASAANNTIVKVDSAGIQSVFASGGNLAGPVGLAFSPNGSLYVANSSNNSIVIVDRRGDQSVFTSGGNLFGPRWIGIRSSRQPLCCKLR
jgi:DNA-binding beta-propeller fold protein YncE